MLSLTADELRDNYLILYDHRQVRLRRREEAGDHLLLFCEELDDGAKLRLRVRPSTRVRASPPLLRPFGCTEASRNSWPEQGWMLTTDDAFYLVLYCYDRGKLVCQPCDCFGGKRQHEVAITYDPGASYSLWRPYPTIHAL